MELHFRFYTDFLLGSKCTIDFNKKSSISQMTNVYSFYTVYIVANGAYNNTRL